MVFSTLLQFSSRIADFNIRLIYSILLTTSPDKSPEESSRWTYSSSFNLLGYGTDNQITQANAITLLSSGYVGIGTTNPVNKLDVAGNISCSAITASNFFGTSSWSTNALTASSLVIANSYQVASLSINTSSVLLPLTIHGTTYSASISGQAANSIFRIGGAGTNAILDMGVNADSSPGFSWLQARSKIDYSTFGNLSLNSVGGNVGVGTTTPSAKLSIGNGSISY